MEFFLREYKPPERRMTEPLDIHSTFSRSLFYLQSIFILPSVDLHSNYSRNCSADLSEITIFAHLKSHFSLKNSDLTTLETAKELGLLAEEFEKIKEILG